ncbi:MAG: SymE family type I addiction module toxin [Candidatus Thiodiazotropha sp.]
MRTGHQWLDQAGFSIHTPIKIKVMEGCLVVTAETSNSG